MAVTRSGVRYSMDSSKYITDRSLRETRFQKRDQLKKKRPEPTLSIQTPSGPIVSSSSNSGFARLSDDEWISIIRHLLGGSMIVYLENPEASKMVSVLFMLNKSVRGAAHRIFYKYVQFTVGVELFISQPGESCRQKLRPEAVKFIEKLSIPGRLVHAFSRPEHEAISMAPYFESLHKLTVKFDAGDWDKRYAIYGKPQWNPKELIHRTVRMNFQSPGLFRWLKSKKQYEVTFKYRFPIDANVYCNATIKEGKAEYEELRDTTPEQLKTLDLWKKTIDLIMT